MMSHLSWKKILPIAQILLAIALLALGNAHRRAFERDVEARSTVRLGALAFLPHAVWDYNEPALELSLAINFPVIVTLAPAVRFASLPVAYALYVIAVGLFWYWIGREIDRQLDPTVVSKPERPNLILLVLYAIACIASAAFAFTSLAYIVHGLFFHLRLLSAAILVWSGIFVAYFGLKLLRRLAPIR